MTDEEIDELPGLSMRAKKLLKRLHDGRWYRCYANDTPQAMGELVKAGLVEKAGRWTTIVACYVPKGFIPVTMEKFPRDVSGNCP